MSYRLSSLPTFALIRSSSSALFPSAAPSSIAPVRLQTRTAVSSQEVPRIIGRKRKVGGSVLENTKAGKALMYAVAFTAAGLTLYVNNPWSEDRPGAKPKIKDEDRAAAEAVILNSEAFKRMMEGKRLPREADGDRVSWRPAEGTKQV